MFVLSVRRLIRDAFLRFQLFFARVLKRLPNNRIAAGYDDDALLDCKPGELMVTARIRSSDARMGAGCFLQA